SYQGGGAREDAHREIPELADSYPEYGIFGVLPAYGFYCRHVRGLSLSNLTLMYEKPDLRPALVCNDVTDLNLSRLGAASQLDGEPLVRLDQVRGAWLQSCRATTGAQTFLQVNGNQSAGITLIGNDLSNVRRAVEFGSDVLAEAIQSCGCRNLLSP